MPLNRYDLKGEARSCYDEWRAWKDYWSNFEERGMKALRFVNGDQWSEEDKVSFQTGKRPVVTINLMAPIVRQITGFRVKERLMPRVRPERDGTVDKALIYSKLLYFIHKKNNIQSINQRVQEDQTITGRGWWELRKSFEDNPMGELKIDHVDWNEITPDFMCKDKAFYSDARAMYRAKWVPKEIVKELYYKEDGTLQGEFPQETVTWRDDTNKLTNPNDKDEFESNGNYLVVEKWYLKKVEKAEATDGASWKQLDKALSPEEVEQSLGTGWVQVKKQVKELWIKTFVPAQNKTGYVFDGKADLQLGTYPFVPALCYMYGEKVSGVIEDLMDEQQRTNKAFSQIIEILGFSAKGFWLIPETAGIDEDEWKLNVARPGGIGRWSGNGTEPKWVQMGQMPQGYAQIFEISQENIKKISGIRPALEGMSEYSGESGFKYAQKLNQAREQLAVIDRRFIDGFSRLCYLEMKALPQVYDYEFAFQALEGEDDVQDIQVNQKTIMGIFNDITSDPGEYEVSIEQVMESTSARQSDLAELSTMMAQVGPSFAALFAGEWIRNSDLPNKEKLAKRLEVMSGQELNLKQMEMQLSAMQAQMQGMQGAQQAQAQNAQIEQNKMLTEAKVGKLKSDIAVSETKADSENFKNIMTAMAAHNKSKETVSA